MTEYMKVLQRCTCCGFIHRTSNNSTSYIAVRKENKTNGIFIIVYVTSLNILLTRQNLFWPGIDENWILHLYKIPMTEFPTYKLQALYLSNLVTRSLPLTVLNTWEHFHYQDMASALYGEADWVSVVGNWPILGKSSYTWETRNKLAAQEVTMNHSTDHTKLTPNNFQLISSCFYYKIPVIISMPLDKRCGCCWGTWDGGGVEVERDVVLTNCS